MSWPCFHEVHRCAPIGTVRSWVMCVCGSMRPRFVTQSQPQGSSLIALSVSANCTGDLLKQSAPSLKLIDTGNQLRKPEKQCSKTTHCPHNKTSCSCSNGAQCEPLYFSSSRAFWPHTLIALWNIRNGMKMKSFWGVAGRCWNQLAEWNSL